MNPHETVRTRSPRRPIALLAAAAVFATGLLAVLGHGSLASASRTPGPTTAVGPSSVLGSPIAAPPEALGDADGLVADGVTVFDGEVPAIAGLDARLLGALREAAADAADDGVTFHVTSGWRSAAYQQQLLDEAISTYGSAEEAARWVSTPTSSLHVRGDAVDVASAAATWLSRHGAAHGLCQIYDNEPWHYELRTDAADHGCPDRYADPTHDPRMQP